MYPFIAAFFLFLHLQSAACAFQVAPQSNTTMMQEEGKVYYHKNGNQFRITPKVTLDLHEKLPVGTYNVGFDELRSEYYLESINDFELKGKIYGDVNKSSSRILNTFLDRHKSTGVLLVGDKGSGKTLLAQYISITAAREKGIPTIVINKPWYGDRFNSFIQSIDQPVVIFLDEFEKVYTTDSEINFQEKILTLFDGVYSSQKLFLLTCNDKYRIDGHMMNRPGRLYYVLEFKGLDQQFVKEYCDDNLLRKDYCQAVCATAALFQSFNFDMLKALVEDMNRYDESPTEVLKYLNVRPDSNGDEKFGVRLIVGGKERKRAQKTWIGNPMSEVIRVSVYDPRGEEEDDDDGEHFFSIKNLTELDPKSRVFKFKNSGGDLLILTPAPALKFSLDYNALAESPRGDSSSADATFVSDTEEEKYKAMMDY